MTISDYLVLHFFTELALYALDVYNQQQIFSHSYSSKIDKEWVGNQYANYYSSASNKLAYPEYPPYYDYYQGTFRSFSREWKDLDKIIMWIQIASEA